MGKPNKKGKARGGNIVARIIEQATLARRADAAIATLMRGGAVDRATVAGLAERCEAIAGPVL